MTVSKNLLKIESHRVPELSQKVRLQEYGVGLFRRLVSRKAVKNAIKKGLVFINSERGYTGDWIIGGETIDLFQDLDDKKPELDFELEVLFEDDHLAVINKPAGILVSGNKLYTIENALSFNLKKSTQPDALSRPDPIHRLDYPTTGALLVSKTATLLMELNQLFENRLISKSYMAVTMGSMSESGTIETPIDGKASRSEFTKLESIASPRFEFLNLVRLHPHTGRRHQLRKHLSEIGNPILGDHRYGIPGTVLKGKGLYLHAHSLQFEHPVTKKEVSIAAPLPKKFGKLFPEA